MRRVARARGREVRCAAHAGGASSEPRSPLGVRGDGLAGSRRNVLRAPPCMETEQALRFQSEGWSHLGQTRLPDSEWKPNHLSPPLAGLCPMPLTRSHMSGQGPGTPGSPGYPQTKRLFQLPSISFQMGQVHEILN